MVPLDFQIEVGFNTDMTIPFPSQMLVLIERVCGRAINVLTEYQPEFWTASGTLRKYMEAAIRDRGMTLDDIDVFGEYIRECRSSLIFGEEDFAAFPEMGSANACRIAAESMRHLNDMMEVAYRENGGQ